MAFGPPPYDEKIDYYAVLGVGRTATDAEIKKAYRKQAVRFHPDKHENASVAKKARAEALFKEINAAYEVLEHHRKEYDDARARPRPQPAPNAGARNGAPPPHHPWGARPNAPPFRPPWADEWDRLSNSVRAFCRQWWPTGTIAAVSLLCASFAFYYNAEIVSGFQRTFGPQDTASTEPTPNPVVEVPQPTPPPPIAIPVPRTPPPRITRRPTPPPPPPPPQIVWMSAREASTRGLMVPCSTFDRTANTGRPGTIDCTGASVEENLNGTINVCRCRFHE